MLHFLFVLLDLVKWLPIRPCFNSIENMTSKLSLNFFDFALIAYEVVYIFQALLKYLFLSYSFRLSLWQRIKAIISQQVAFNTGLFLRFIGIRFHLQFVEQVFCALHLSGPWILTTVSPWIHRFDPADTLKKRQYNSTWNDVLIRLSTSSL